MLTRYTLMHRDAEVADIEIEDGYLTRITRVHEKQHAPIGTMNVVGNLGVSELRFWLQRRQIPHARAKAAEDLERVGLVNPGSALESSLACSLSDTYWIRPHGADVGWKDVNLFENDFSQHHVSKRQVIPTADASTSGDQPKHWAIADDGQRLLVKQANVLLPQQVANEIIGSTFAEALDIPHVTYWLSRDRKASICATMADEHTDYVCAYDILQQQRFPTGALDNDLRYLKAQFEEHDLDFDHAISDMALADMAMRNEDRHWTNFGILRDAETLEWRCAAPLFDFGNSLWFKEATQGGEPRSKMSGRTLMGDLIYVQDVTPRQVAALESLPEVAESILTECGMPRSHTDFVASELRHRTKRIIDATRNKRKEETKPCKKNSMPVLTGYGKKSETTSTLPSHFPCMPRPYGDASLSSSAERPRSSTVQARTGRPSEALSSAPTPSRAYAGKSPIASSTSCANYTPTSPSTDELEV